MPTRYRARVLNFSHAEDASDWMTRMGCDPVGVSIMAHKAVFRTICVENVPAKAANLLKQTFLAKGAEVAVARGTADLSVDCTDVLICGTLKHYRLALAQLARQPWGLPELAEAVVQALRNDGEFPARRYECRGLSWNVEQGRTLVMGILNLTPDSFSDGGRYLDTEAAVLQARKLEEEGADILDVGAESTRPYGSVRVPADEEMKRLLPVLERILAEVKIPVSVDTYKSEVALRALEKGAHILNDVRGLQSDPGMAEAAAAYHVPVVVMHNRDSVESKGDIMSEISSFFSRSADIAVRAGILPENLILDPGIGFGKTARQNIEILGRLSELKAFGCPILVGTSRKRFIGDILGLPVDEREEGTAATVAHSIINGASIVRVHDVKRMKRVAKMTDALQERRNGNG